MSARRKSFMTQSLQDMPHFLAFRRQIPAIVFVRLNLDRQPLDNAQSIALDADDFHRIIRQQTHLPPTEGEQDLCSDTVVPQVGPKAEALVRLDRVESFFLL